MTKPVIITTAVQAAPERTNVVRDLTYLIVLATRNQMTRHNPAAKATVKGAPSTVTTNGMANAAANARTFCSETLSSLTARRKALKRPAFDRCLFAAFTDRKSVV